MSDRLQELQRQRALAQEQLAWFEREIARELAAPGQATVPAPPSPAAPTSVPAAASPVALTDAAAEKILDEYRSSPTVIKRDVTKGCFLYFFTAFALLAAAVAILYFATRR